MVAIFSRLLENPVVASIIIMVVYLVFLIIGEVASLIISNRVLIDAPLLAQASRFVILFSLNCFVWF